MGQKVNPSSFRLDVPHRGHSSLRFRSTERRELLGQSRYGLTSQVNPSGSPDFKGWDHSIRGFKQSDMAFGEYLGFLSKLEAEVAELAISCSRVLNRTSSLRTKVASGRSREVSFQWIPLDGLPRSQEEHLGLQAAVRRREWKAEEAWMTHGLSMQGMGGLSLKLVSINLLEKAYASEHWRNELSSMMTQTGLDKEEEVSRTSKLNKAPGEAEAKGKQEESKQQDRVAKSVLLKGFRLSGVFPVAQLMTNLLCFMVEDEESQTKALNDFHQLRLISSESKEYGLLRYEMDSGESLNYGMKAKGGYRGCRMVVKGRLDGSRRTRVETIQMGVVPLSTRSAPRDWAHRSATTKYGSMGVEVIYSY